MLLKPMDLKRWVAMGVSGVLVLLAFVLMVWPKSATLMVVDMTRAIQMPSMMLAQSKLSQEAQLKIMTRFSALLPEVIKAYGQMHHVTIVSAPVLASDNRDDITNEVVNRTIARMKQDA